MKDLISVIVPVFNVEKFLPRCLDSILSQSYSNLDIILVDDGSTDGSKDICDEYKNKDERIRVVHKEHAGVSNARNIGLEMARGDFVAFIDSDDWLEINTYDKLIKKQHEENLDLVFFRIKRISADGQEINIIETDLQNFCLTKDCLYFFRNSSKIVKTDNGVKIFGNIMGSVCRVLFKRNAISDFRFDEGIEYMEDTAFLFSIINSSNLKLGFVDEQLYNYLMRGDSRTHSLDFDIVQNCKYYVKYFESVLNGKDGNRLLDAIKFLCYTECVIAKIKYEVKLDLKSISFWNTRIGYKEKLKLSLGFKQKIKFFCVRHNLFFVLKILFRLKRK